MKVYPLRHPPSFTVFSLLLLLAIVATFFPALGHGWVFDDSANFTSHDKWRGLNAETLHWMWSTSHMGHFIPVTWMTLGLDYEIWGLDPFGFHLSNLLWHWATSLAFLALFHKLLAISLPAIAHTHPSRLKWAAFIATLFFAIHPLRVESVVWITERRDMVSGALVALCGIFYLRYSNTTCKYRWGNYLLAFVCFTGAMLSKPITMTLPAVLLVLDFYPLKRAPIGDRRKAVFLLIEKLPFFAVGFGLAWYAYQLQFAVGLTDWLIPYEIHSLWSRILQVAYGACYYGWTSLLPLDLSPLYLLNPPLTLQRWPLSFTLLCFLGITSYALFSVRRHPVVLVSWLTYGILLSPVLGLTQNGPQIVADRYSYLGCLPFAVLLGAGVAYLPQLTSQATKRGLILLLVLALPIYGLLAFRYSTHWHNQETLWSKAIAEDPAHFYGYANRGRYYHDQYFLTGDKTYLGLALSDYNNSLEAHPTYSVALNNRAILLWNIGKHVAALHDLNTILALNPDYTQALFNRARLHLEMGNRDAARADLRHAIATAPAGFSGIDHIRALLAVLEENTPQ